MTDRARLLVPCPQRLDLPGGELALPAEPTLSLAAAEPAAAPVADRLAAELAGHGLHVRLVDPAVASPTIRLAVGDDAPDRPEAYRLHVSPGGAEIVGRDAAGLFYGACTLVQWVRLHAQDLARERPGERLTALPALHVEDWPDLPMRGVMLDISRDKVPTMATLRRLVDLLASLKVNQLQLYMEHTFAYRGHEDVWRTASPMTAEEVQELDAFCRARFVELVPNQNSFGHFHRWLVHDRYRPLAEVPEGFEHPFSPTPEPFSLCPTDPRVPDLLADLYDQLLPSFTSASFNVGLDETMDLGKGRSKAECERRGKEEVYLDFLHTVHRLVAERGRRMQFWGDIIVGRPDLIPRLPQDAVALEWGYEAGHPWGEHLERFAASGLEFVVCPGTSSWLSFTGRVHNMLLDVGEAAAAGAAAGAAGLLNTDWGDHGHLQPLPVSYPGFVAGAAFAWNVGEAGEPLALPLAELLDRHVLHDAAGVAGEALVRLGNAYRETGALNYNGTALFHLVVNFGDELSWKRYRGMTREGLEWAIGEIDGAFAGLAGHRMAGKDGALAARELEWAGGLARAGAELGLDRLAAGGAESAAPVVDLPAAARARHAEAVERLAAEHGALWQPRYRPGGRRDSRRRLERLAGALREP